jgi:hypothetical protein
MVLSRETYFKKYIGKENKRLTKAYIKRGRIISNHQTLIAKYSGISALKNGTDTVGYLVDGKIHSTKTKADRNRKSKQSWEGGAHNDNKKRSCGSNHDDKKRSCGSNHDDKK